VVSGWPIASGRFLPAAPPGAGLTTRGNPVRKDA
jgi:hypothetical protein